MESDVPRKDVPRKQVIQACLDLFPEPTYLEIGVWKGKTLFPVTAVSKTAVDPAFAFDLGEMREKHSDTHFFEVTSDDFFASLDSSTHYDVIYLDGLHTFEQTLRDLLNSILFVKEESIIIIDDVYPSSYHSSLPDVRAAKLLRQAMGSTDSSWMGDVYKLTLFIETFLQQYSYGMVSDNHGQLIMWRKPRQTVAKRTVEEVARCPFETLHVEQQALNRAPLAAIIAGIREERGPSK